MATPKTTLWARDPHTVAKHKLLDRYLAAWTPIMAKQFREKGFTFVDGFAGPGEYTNSSESSPVIAMRHATREDVAQYRTPQRLLFLEEHAGRAAHLAAVLTRTFPTEERPSSIHVATHRGSCEFDLQRLMTEIGAWQGPIFANLDGWGVDTPFHVVARIAQQKSSEVLITFQGQWFTRFASLTDLPAGDAVFGDTSWRQVKDLPTAEKQKFLVTHYRDQLRSAGFSHTLTFEMVDEGGHSLFLIFGTSNERGVEKMKDALWIADRVGGARYRDPRDPAQMTFSIDAPDFTPLRRRFVDHLLKAGSEDLEVLARQTLEETIYRKADAKRIIDELVNDTVVEQVANGRSYREKTYRLTNKGMRAPQQTSLFS